MQSSIKIEEYIQYAKKNNLDTLALADTTMHGAYKFYSECKKEKIKPLIGLIVKIKTNHIQGQELIIYPKNSLGYSNVLEISSMIEAEKNREISLSELEPYAKNLIALTSPNIQKANFINEMLQNKQMKIDFLENCKKIFENNFYISIQITNDYEKDYIALEMQSYCKLNSFTNVVCNEVKYLQQENSEVVDYLNAISKNKKLLIKQPVESFLIEGAIEYQEIEKKFKEELSNSIKIASNIELDLYTNKPQTRYLESELQGLSSDEFLKSLCIKGLEKRIKIEKIDEIDEYNKRLRYELEVIIKMGYSDYFLIVWDIIRHSKKMGILVGPGRGSAAGSLVAYVLGITNVDPIKYELLFERFLNPERIDMPDIDLDFPDDRRDEVVKYVLSKYGEKNVAQIVTYNKYLIKNAIRDIARVHNIDLKLVNKLVKFFNGSNPNVRGIVTSNKELITLLQVNVELKQVLKIAMKFMGLIRHTSVHAAGVIISNEPLHKYIGISAYGHEIPITQLDMKDLAKIGLLKFDFLSIRNLTLIKSMEENIKELEPEFDINKIPLTNEKVYKLLTYGLSYGTFQLESEGIRKAMRAIKINDFNDLVLMLALYRPGPSNNIYEVANRKNGSKKILYENEVLKQILEKTYGIMIYQEQVMQILQRIGGYSLGEADILRRAISKKVRKVIEEEKINFINGSLNRGYSKELANKLYTDIVRFADYGFNLSHAVSYAIISYQMMYVKANYLKIFLKTIFNYTRFDQTLYDKWKNELKVLKIKILSPLINESDELFSTTENGLMMGLIHINSITSDIAKHIILERRKKMFISVEDFIVRTINYIKKEHFKMLVYAGAFQEFNTNYNELVKTYDFVCEDMRFSQSDLFEPKRDFATKLEDMSVIEKSKNKILAIKVDL